MRIGILGLGFMGSMHVKALRSVAGAELAAVYSGDPRKLTGDLSGIQGNLGGSGERYDFSSVAKYSSIEALLADKSLDAVDICLPTDLHAPVTLDALRAGKHVLVEKPIALDGESARQLISEARAQDRILMAAQVLRFLPAYEVLRQRLHSGDLGVTRWAMFRRRCAAPAWSKWLKDAVRSGGGVFDLLIHDVDMCLHLFGMPRTVSATGYEDMENGIDVMLAELRYPNANVIVTGGWHHPRAYPFSMEYTVVSDAGTLEYSSSTRPPTLYHLDGTEEALAVPERDGYAAELAYFVKCCRERSQPELCRPEESAEAVALMRLLLQSRSEQGETLECTL